MIGPQIIVHGELVTHSLRVRVGVRVGVMVRVMVRVRLSMDSLRVSIELRVRNFGLRVRARVSLGLGV